MQINEQIRDSKVRVISETGEQLGVMSAPEAQKIADDKELDLVKVSPNANPPVCKIMNYGKYVFEMAKREKEVKKNQKTIEVKEIRLSVTIDVGDINTKAKACQKFIKAGNKVKVSIRMRGRQMAHQNLAYDVLNNFYEQVKDCCIIEKKPLLEGRNIFMMLVPNKG